MSRQALSRISAALIALLGVTTLCARAQFIEPLPDGFYPKAASADGSVVTGYVVTEDQRSLAAYWTAEDGIKTISDPSTGAYETYVNDVSADGTIIVGATRFNTGDISQKGWMWTEETGLVHLPAPSLGDEELYVYWASAVGVEAGKVTIVGTANDRAVRWVNGGQPEILGGFNPYDVSDDGSVIVGDGDDGNGQKAAIKWVNGARSVIQDASDERLSVSANGNYIAGYDRPSGSPARWATVSGDKEVLTDEWGGTALSISGDGSVAVGQAYKTFESGPFVWRARGGFRMLRDLLENDYGVDLSEWPFFDSINRLTVTDAGNVVIGEGPAAMPSLRITLCGTPMPWENTAGGFFADASSWAGKVVPDSIHTAVFDSGVSYTVNFDGDAAVNRLEAWSGEDLTLALGGNAFTLTALCNGPSAIVDGAFLDVEDGTVDAMDAVVLSGSEPVLHLDAGARLVVDSDEEGFDCLIADGEDGEALVSVADGGMVESLSCSAFGSAPSTAGRLVVEGGGRFVTKELALGRDGEGGLEVPQGVVDARHLIMAESESSSATATVEQIGELRFRDEATVGVRGKAEVRLNEFSVMIGGDPDASAVSLLILGRELEGQGQLILEEGSGFFGSDAVVGQDGLGNIQVKSGSLAEIRRIWVGGHLEGTEGVGGVYVDGSGSQLLARRMWLGRGGFGVLEVTNGGLVRADRIEVYGSPYWVTEESGGVIKAPVIYLGGAPSAGKKGMEDVDGIVADTLALVGEWAAIVAGTVAFGPQSTLEAELNLSGEPLVAIDGAVQLGGRLRVSVAEGYTPFVGDRHIIVQAASVQGAFEGVHVPIDLRVTLEYTDTTAVAVVTSVTVGAEDERLEMPSGYALHPVYPNPFNPSAQIDFDLPAASDVTLTVYDALGRRVAVLVDGNLAAGRHGVRFDGANLPSGNYLVRLEAGSFSQTRNLTLLK